MSLPRLDVARCRLISLDVRGDERGSLVSIEAATGLPFSIGRVYYIFGTREGVSRGFHAHRQLTQLAVCVAGSVDMVVDDGERREAITLDRPDLGMLIGNHVWREMHKFSSDCVLMVLADRAYDEADYLRDYASFIEVVRGS